MVRGFSRSIYASWVRRQHIRELPTPDQHKKLGLDPTPQMPHPPLFGQHGRHHRGH